MNADDDDAPERDRFRTRNRDHEIGPKKRTMAGAILGSVFGLAMVYAAVAFNFGLFPFGGTGERATLKKLIVEQLRIPVETVEITGEGAAVGTLATGEKLAIRWKRDGNMMRCICQQPKADAEQTIRQTVTQLGFVPKALDLRQAPAGVGYVGEATAESGEVFDVTESTDLTNFVVYQYAKISPASYPVAAKNMMQRSVNAPVIGVEPIRPGDLPPNRHAATVVGKRETVYSARMRTADKAYAVELVTETSPEMVTALTAADVKILLFYFELPN